MFKYAHHIAIYHSISQTKSILNFLSSTHDAVMKEVQTGKGKDKAWAVCRILFPTPWNNFFHSQDDLG